MAFRLLLHAVSARRMAHCRTLATRQPLSRPRGRMKDRRKRLVEQETALSAHKNDTPKMRRYDGPAAAAGDPSVDPSKCATASTPADTLLSASSLSNWMDRARSMSNDLATIQYWLPKRYRRPVAIPYQREHGHALAQRLPWFVVLIGILTYDETAPFQLVRIHGPSMLPTMAADGSDVWLSLPPWWWWKNRWRRGDIVGFAHPDERNPRRISCKRIVGLPGDRVRRYGQYVHLFTQQDPKYWGIAPIPQDGPHQGTYGWVRDDWWDSMEGGVATTTDDHPAVERQQQQQRRDPTVELVVPEGHVWLEADCPGFGIDSRHFGPVPTDWICGKVVARVWPLGPLRHKTRPHPMPLDKETLMEHNVFRVPSP